MIIVCAFEHVISSLYHLRWMFLDFRSFTGPGRYFAATDRPEASTNSSIQIAYPPANCVLAPRAKRLAKRAGQKALKPLMLVNANAFNVPKTLGEGEMSFMES